MKADYLNKALYALAGTALMLNACWMLVQPSSWIEFVTARIEIGPASLHFVRELGGAYLALGITSFWCMLNLEQRFPAHWVLTVFFTAMAGVYIADIYTGTVRAGVLPWLCITPAILFILSGIPVNKMLSPKEQSGTVKWFNKKKGFGFIIADNGEEVFVHFRSIADENARVLKQGQSVEFRLVQGKKGPQAEQVRST